jgi:hypothetical protein
VHSIDEADGIVTALMTWDNGDKDDRKAVLASTVENIKPVLRFTKLSGVAVFSSFIRLGKGSLHKACVDEIELPHDIVGTGCFGIFLSTKVLKYSVSDPKIELKHAKALKYGGTEVILVASFTPQVRASSTSDTWSFILRSFPALFDIFALQSPSGTPKEIFLSLGSALALDTRAASSASAINFDATQYLGVRVQVRKQGGFGSTSVVIVHGNGEGTTFDATKEDLPVRAFSIETNLLLQRIDNVAELESVLSPGFVSMLSACLLKWRPLAALVELAPWGTVQDFMPYLFKLREAELDGDLGALGMALFKQGLSSLVSEVTLSDKMGQRTFTKQQASEVLTSFTTTANALVNLSDTYPQLFHAEEVSSGKTRALRELAKGSMPNEQQLPSQKRMQDEMGGGGGAINSRNTADKEGKGGGKGGGKGSNGNGSNGSSSNGSGSNDKADKRDRSGTTGLTPNGKKGTTTRRTAEADPPDTDEGRGPTNLFTPLGEAQALSAQLSTAKQQILSLEGRVRELQETLAITNSQLATEQAKVRAQQQAADHYVRLQTYAASAHATVQGLQTQLQKAESEVSFFKSCWMAQSMGGDVLGRLQQLQQVQSLGPSVGAPPTLGAAAAPPTLGAAAAPPTLGAGAAPPTLGAMPAPLGAPPGSLGAPPSLG